MYARFLDKRPPVGHPGAMGDPYDDGYRDGYAAARADLQREVLDARGRPYCGDCLTTNPAVPLRVPRRGAYCPHHSAERTSARNRNARRASRGQDPAPYEPTPAPGTETPHGGLVRVLNANATHDLARVRELTTEQHHYLQWAEKAGNTGRVALHRDNLAVLAELALSTTEGALAGTFPYGPTDTPDDRDGPPTVLRHHNDVQPDRRLREE